MKPRIILVHGAYADSASWNGVVEPLLSQNYGVTAFATPLRGVRSDAALLDDLVRSVDGPVVLVGHSYGGAVINNVEASDQIAAAVYIAGFALEAGESCADAAALAPGSTLGDTLLTVPLAGGGTDTYIDQPKYHHQFAADLSPADSALMGVSQRPVTAEALAEPSGENPVWRTVPSWFLFGELDRNIPAGAHRIMAERAAARESVEIPGASHVVGISHPSETLQIILQAAGAQALAGA